MLKITGELNGVACLLLTHQSAVQFLATSIPRTPQQEEKREMGFHTIIEGVKIGQAVNQEKG